MTTDEFRDYIQRSVDRFKGEDEKRPVFEMLLNKSNRRNRKSKNQDEGVDGWYD